MLFNKTVVLNFGVGRVEPGQQARFVVEILRQSHHSWCDAIADQIEAQTKPPKPVEPTGLGAVVEDAAGDRWVRACVSDCEDGRGCIPWSSVRWGHHKQWHEVNAVRIVSEGVTA